jgi:hypothetical protein
VPDSIGADVLLDEPLDGIASWVAAIDPAISDAEAVERLSVEFRGAGLSLPVERGVSDVLSKIVARLRGREPMDDLGEAPSAFDLLALHVPPGGRAALQVDQQGAADQRVNIQVLGFGYGGGRKLSIALRDDIAERATCMRVVQHVVVRVRRLKPNAVSSEPLVTSDVVRCGQRELSAWPDCPLCGSEEPDPFRFDVELERALDLRGYDAELRRDESYHLEGEHSADIGIALTAPGGAPLNAGFHLKRQTSISCTVSYRFVPKRFYRPYRLRGDRSTLPSWYVG